MIRFIDKQVTCIKLEEYNRGELAGSVANNKKSEDVLFIYSESEYYGFSTYETIQNKYGNNGIIIEKFVVKNNIFTDLANMFKRYKALKYIPIFNDDMALICFAYQYSDKMVERIENAFTYLEMNEDILFLEEFYPQIEKICLYGFNEFSFRFYQILIQKKYSVQVFGEKWNHFLPDLNNDNKVQGDYENIPIEKIMNIYAEGTGLIWNENKITFEWRFVFAILKANLFYKMEKWKNYLVNRNIFAFTMIFPDFRELDFCSPDETYRFRMGLHNELDCINTKNEFIVQQITKCWCKGGGY